MDFENNCIAIRAFDFPPMIRCLVDYNFFKPVIFVLKFEAANFCAVDQHSLLLVQLIWIQLAQRRAPTFKIPIHLLDEYFVQDV